MGGFGSAGAALDALPEIARRGGRQRPLAIATKAAVERELEGLTKAEAKFVAWGEPAYPPALAAIIAVIHDILVVVGGVITQTALLISVPASLLGRFAGHGGIQKYGDELAGMKPAEGQDEVDIDDMVIEMEKLDENIQKGEWSTRKEGDGMGGTSVLIKALVAYGGKTVEQVKAFLKDKDPKFKTALRLDDKRQNREGKTMAQIVREIEAAKASKGVKVDTGAALADLDAMGGEEVQTA